jgi:hypothetical protein
MGFWSLCFKVEDSGKPTEAKVDKHVEVVKCIALLHSIIVDIRVCMSIYHQTNVTAWMQITVFSSKDPE